MKGTTGTLRFLGFLAPFYGKLVPLNWWSSLVVCYDTQEESIYPTYMMSYEKVIK